MKHKNAECQDCVARLNSYVDNELDTKDAALVLSHLDKCPACRAKLSEVQMLSNAVSHVAYHTAPEALARRVAQMAGKAKAPARNSDLLRWFMPAFSSAALAFALMLYVAMPSAQDAVTDEIIASHVRSLMEQHLTDVVSTDQHTVKPWFAGRIDFSPPVKDFADKGFALAGGRLDYIQHQKAAALVYRHKKHVINVFIIPLQGRDMVSHAIDARGYHLIEWRENNMFFAAVSDMDEDGLKDLADLIRAKN